MGGWWWVGWVEEDETVRMSYWKGRLVGGRRRRGAWVGGTYLFLLIVPQPGLEVVEPITLEDADDGLSRVVVDSGGLFGWVGG